MSSENVRHKLSTQYIKDWISKRNESSEDKIDFTSIHMLIYRENGVEIFFYYTTSADDHLDQHRMKINISDNEFRYYKLGKLLE